MYGLIRLVHYKRESKQLTQTNHMSLEKKDIELIEQIIYKNSDDIAVSISRSFERLEERLDASESRVLTRMSEVEDTIEGSRQNISDALGDLRTEIRDIGFVEEDED